MGKVLRHLPLEPYKQRYTEFLKSWEQEAFSKKFNVQTIEVAMDTPLAANIRTGEVLDSHTRPIWAMRQIQSLLDLGESKLGTIYFSDFFHPGLEALPYSRRKFKSAAFLWAQTFDKYDFTTQFVDWMRAWEYMACYIYDKIFVACEELRELIIAAMPYMAAKLITVGLPFNSKFVTGAANIMAAPTTGCPQVIYSSRWDLEKQPDLFLDVVEHCSDITFGVCTGWPELRGTATQAIERATYLSKKPKSNLQLFTGLSKDKYYGYLVGASAQFNCAKQDWISFTLLEALTFNCIPIYPNFRSFPAALNYDADFLYAPDSMGSAIEHLRYCLNNKTTGFADKLAYTREAILSHHDGSLDRITDELATL
jgi:glycosyltransferase involved in cell wall biosynthesis